MEAAANQIVATIPLPGKPEFPQVDGKGNVFVNIEDKNIIVKLDAKTKKVLTSWELTGCEAPSGMAIDHTQHRLFSVCDGNKMAISDFGAGKVIGLASIGDSPDAAAYDAKNHLAFSSNGQGTLSVIDASKAGFPTVQTVTTVKGPGRWRTTLLLAGSFSRRRCLDRLRPPLPRHRIRGLWQFLGALRFWLSRAKQIAIGEARIVRALFLIA
jgi:hypothetical protein